MPENAIPTPNVDAVPPLHVVVTREYGMEYLTLWLDDGTSEEFEVEECKQWFKDRGANMDKIDKALDHCWNFYRVELNIHNPKEPPKSKLAHAPKV